MLNFHSTCIVDFSTRADCPRLDFELWVNPPPPPRSCPLRPSGSIGPIKIKQCTVAHYSHNNGVGYWQVWPTHSVPWMSAPSTLYTWHSTLWPLTALGLPDLTWQLPPWWWPLLTFDPWIWGQDWPRALEFPQPIQGWESLISRWGHDHLLAKIMEVHVSTCTLN